MTVDGNRIIDLLLSTTRSAHIYSSYQYCVLIVCVKLIRRYFLLFGIYLTFNTCMLYASFLIKYMSHTSFTKSSLISWKSRALKKYEYLVFAETKYE